MYDLLSAKEIRKNLRVNYNINVSLEAIHHTAQDIGYKIKRIGGKKGYHKSVYTALQRHWSELLSYDQRKADKMAENEPNDYNDEFSGEYYTMNGEPDRIDYEWEIEDSVVREAVNAAIVTLLNESKEQRALQTNIFGGVDDLTEKNKAEAKKRAQAKRRKELFKEKKEKKEMQKRRIEFEKDSKRMVGGGLFGNDEKK